MEVSHRIQKCQKMNFSKHMDIKRRKKMTNRYHFSLHLQFQEDCDVNKLEKIIGLQSYKKNMLNESKGQNKTAKLWFKTSDYSEPDTYAVFEKILSKIKEKLEIIKQANDNFRGKTTLTLYFEELHQKPYIKLSKDDMELLSKNGISFDVDFRI